MANIADPVSLQEASNYSQEDLARTYIHTFTRTCVHTYMRTYTHTYSHPHTLMYRRMYMCVHILSHASVFVNRYMSSCLKAYRHIRIHFCFYYHILPILLYFAYIEMSFLKLPCMNMYKHISLRTRTFI